MDVLASVIFTQLHTNIDSSYSVCTTDMLGLTLVLTGLALVILCWFLGTLKRCPGPNMPGPSGPPYIGSTLQIDRKAPHKTFQEWSKRYGPIYKFQAMGQYIVVLGSHEIITKALSKSGYDFATRPYGYRLHTLTDGGRGVGFGYFSPALVLMRNIALRELKMQSGTNADAQHAMDALNGELMDTLRASQGETYNPRKDIRNFVLKSIFHVVAGENTSYNDERYAIIQDYEEMTEKLNGLEGEGKQLDMFPWLRWFGHPAYAKVKHLLKVSESLWVTQRSKLMETLDQHSAPGVMHEMLVAQGRVFDDENKPVLHDIDLKRTFIALFIAGIANLSTSMQVVMNNLAYHATIQQQIYAEIQKTFDGKVSVGQCRDGKLPYTRAFLFELLRHSALAPFGLPRAAISDVEFEGYNIPKGTMVLTNLWHLHHDDTFWDDSYAFKPERFLDCDGQLVPSNHPNRKHILPFGNGHRSCLGENYTMVRMLLFICSLVQNFEIQAVNTERDPCDPRTFTAGLALHPGPCKLRILPRT